MYRKCKQIVIESISINSTWGLSGGEQKQDWINFLEGLGNERISLVLFSLQFYLDPILSYEEWEEV